MKKEVKVRGRAEMSKALEGTPFAKEKNPKAHEMLTGAMEEAGKKVAETHAEYGKMDVIRDERGRVIKGVTPAEVIQRSTQSAEGVFKEIELIARDLAPELNALPQEVKDNYLQEMATHARRLDVSRLRDLRMRIFNSGERSKTLDEHLSRIVQARTEVQRRPLPQDTRSELNEQLQKAEDILRKHVIDPTGDYHKTLHEARLNLLPVEQTLEFTHFEIGDHGIVVDFKRGFNVQIDQYSARTAQEKIYAELKEHPELLKEAWKRYDKNLTARENPDTTRNLDADRIIAELKKKRDGAA